MSAPLNAETAICGCGESLVSSQAARQLPEYTYDRLSLSHSCRVFVLAPGAGNEQIQGRLEEVALPQEIVWHGNGLHPDQRGGYDALSYTWTSTDTRAPSLEDETDIGTFGWRRQPKPHAVTVDEHWSLPVTCNLFSALLRLRNTDKEQKLFIDALSIDQGTDTDALIERAEQIKRMGHVFSHADIVYADLGNIDDGADRALPMLQAAASIDNDSWVSTEDSPKHLRREKYPSEVQSAVSDPERCLSFAALFSRKYWRRLWCVQEVSLARKPLVLLNRQLMSQRDLETGYVRLVFLFVHERQNWPGETQQLVIQSMLRMGPFLTVVANYMSSVAYSDSPTVDGGGVLALWGRGSAFFEAEAPHDQVYALLGLTTDEQRAATVVDYSTPYDQLLASVAAYAVHQGYLSVLLHQIGGRKRPPSLPSWCLDPRFPARHDLIDYRSMNSWRKNDGFHASQGASLNARHTVLGNNLSVDGVGCCTIAAATELWAEAEMNRDWRYRSTAPLWNCYSIFKAFTDDEKVIDHNSTVTGMLWTALSAEDKCYIEPKIGLGDLDPDTWVRDAGRILENWLDQHGPGFTFRTIDLDNENEDLAARRLLESTLYTAGNRYFAVTSDGRPGLVPEGTEAADTVVVLYDCPTCYVIRPTGRGTFTYMGSAYIYGLMNGEAMEPGRYQRELFVLE